MPITNEPLSRVAQYVHRIVFGNGPIPDKPLSRIEWMLSYAIEKGISGINNGYYYNGQFYKDEEHTELLEAIEGALYYDKTGKKIYLYDGTEYTEVGSGGGVKPYLSLERLSNYLYNVSFLKVPEYIDVNTNFGGACSAYVKDGKLYRNLDWKYDNEATFHVTLPGIEGNAFINGLTNEHLNDTLIGQLPYHLVDGVNEHGIMVSCHVLYNDFDYHNDGNIPLTNLPYIVLSRVKSMATLAADLTGVLDKLKVSAAMEEAEYLIQVLVTDGTTTCILRPTDNSTYEIVNATANPKLTNFRWVPDAEVVRTNLQTRPTGVERWNLMPADLKNLRYTKCYEAPDRLSEFIGIDDTTKDTPDEDLQTIYNGARTAYLNRQRDGTTWQTMHSAVYNQNGLERFWIQEDWDKNYISNGTDSSVVVNGYYMNGNFYTDSTYTIECDKSIYKIYIDRNSNLIYSYDGSKYVSVNDTLPMASNTVAGVTKLYNFKGQNIDGAITQKEFTDELNKKFEVEIDQDEEMAIFSISI